MKKVITGQRFRTKFSLFGYILIATLGIHAQSNNTVTGFVQDQGRNPIDKASVEISDDFHRLLARTVTDGGGKYSFFRLPLGRFSIRVIVLGTNFEEQTVEIEISSAARSSSSSETIQQNFRMRQKSGDSTGSQSAGGVIFVQEIPKEAQNLYVKAVSYLKNKQTDEGISQLKNAINICPTYYMALDKLGGEYITLQKFDDAVAVLTVATQVNSRSYSSQYSLAYSLYQIRKYPEALGSVDKSLELTPASVNGLFLRGMVLKQMGQFQDAVDSLNQARKKSPEPAPDIYWQLSLIYTNNLKKYPDAANELEKFLKAKPNYSEADKVRDLIKKLRAKS